MISQVELTRERIALLSAEAAEAAQRGPKAKAIELERQLVIERKFLASLTKLIGEAKR